MALTLIYDGGCPFCRDFASRSELNSGIGGFQIIDGRADSTLRRDLLKKGISLANGAVLIENDQLWHGSEAIAELSRRMNPSDPLLGLLRELFQDQPRARLLYPLLLTARRVALGLKGLPVDPDKDMASG